jgi:hypothetical protein
LWQRRAIFQAVKLAHLLREGYTLLWAVPLKHNEGGDYHDRDQYEQ